MTDTPTSLEALGIKPVAWLYVHEFSTGTRHSVVCPQSERMESPESRGWAETPLYSATDLAPLIAKARRVDELEAENARLRQKWADLHNKVNIVGSPYHTAMTALDDIVTDLRNQARAALKENTDATSD